jgi:uncharacterized protein YutD
MYFSISWYIQSPPLNWDCPWYVLRPHLKRKRKKKEEEKETEEEEKCLYFVNKI